MIQYKSFIHGGIMGLLVEGKWVDSWYDTKSTKGKFVRQESQFREKITANGPFKAEKGRYHLYVSLACPWAHRTLIYIKLKNLEDYFDISIVHPHMLENGWTFDSDFEDATGDKLFGFDFMHQVYTKAKADYTGRVTVPVIWDKQTNMIVNNESSEIIRMFNTAFNHVTGNDYDYYPADLQQEIDDLNQRIYPNINNGVYKAGFATTQEAYEEAIAPLFNCLDDIEKRLQENGPYLCGDRITEADWRLFTTLIRFDPVYVGHFKCNLKRIIDYPYLKQYTESLFNQPGVKETVNFPHIKSHYYYSHSMINPTQIVPQGPDDYIGS